MRGFEFVVGIGNETRRAVDQRVIERDLLQKRWEDVAMEYELERELRAQLF